MEAAIVGLLLGVGTACGTSTSEPSTTSGAGAGGSGTGGGASGVAGTTPNTGFPDPDVAARAGVVIGSCHPDNGVSRETAAIWRGRERGPETVSLGAQAECIVAAGGGCDALASCLGWSLERSQDCTEGARCHGSTFSLCMSSVELEYAIDCATMGLVCDPMAMIDNVAGAGRACRRQLLTACDEAIFAPYCNGDVPVWCEGVMVMEGAPCAMRGLTCSGSTCTGTGEACTLDVASVSGGATCQGDVLERCTNGRLEDIDCKKYGVEFSCRTVAGAVFCGLASECVPAALEGQETPQAGNPEPVCDGTSIVFCHAGRLERIDCASLGFTGCDLDAGLGCIPSPVSEFASTPPP